MSIGKKNTRFFGFFLGIARAIVRRYSGAEKYEWYGAAGMSL